MSGRLRALLGLLMVVCLKASAQSSQIEATTINRLLLVTTTVDPSTDAFQRFNRSVQAYNLDLTVITGGPDGASQRLESLRKALTTHKNEEDLVVMVVDGQSSVINGNQREILQRFSKFKPATKVVFSSDPTCWPDASLEPKYPRLQSSDGNRFLNHLAFIGFAPKLWELLNWEPAGNQEKESLAESEQLFFTNVYLDPAARQQLAIELDHRAELFQNLDWLTGDVKLEFKPDGVSVKNSIYQSEPVVVHAKQASGRVMLNSLGNYLGKAWTMESGCRHCNDSSFSLSNSKTKLPKVLLGIFIEEPTPFLEQFFADTLQLSYPYSRIHLYVHNSIEYHDRQVDDFVDQHGPEYASSQVLKSYKDNINEWEARNEALKKCRELNCDYYFSLDSIARLELQDTLRILIEANRTIVAPMLNRPRKLWSNFWGALTPEGFYARSYDYIELVRQDRIGAWNVPHIMNAYLIEGSFIRRCLDKQDETTKESPSRLSSDLPRLTYHEADVALKPALTFTHYLRQSQTTFQYMLNSHDFGHLVDPTNYNTSLAHPDFNQLQSNIVDWERKYLHDDYYKHLEDNTTHLEQPCQDVFWFPLVNDLFCDTLINIMESYGQWSGGTNDDPRIEGGYESVPTRDIHMRQVGLHEMWLNFLQEYVMPMQLKEYIGYEHDPPRADLAFVVRYHPAEQPSLRAHHDSSTYTLNIALNRPGADYQGGGCRFIRYNCSVTETRKGWALFHPGRLTHYHEGLPVSNGTRYIMVTFVDP